MTSELMAKTDNYLRETSLSHDSLTLCFKYNIGDIKHFTIKKRGMIKHVYDIKNAALPNTKNIAQYKAKGVQAFRIAQYNKKTLRLVIEATVAMKGTFQIKGRQVKFFLPISQTINKKITNNRKTTKRLKPYRKGALKKHRYVKSKKRYAYNFRRKRQTIILDSGHGGRDIGASSKKVREKDLTLSMTLKLKNILRKMGYRVLMTKSRDKFMNLKQRTDYAHKYKGSIFVSIHANAAPKKKTKGVRYEGIEVFYLGLKNSKRVSKNRAVYHGKKVYSKRAYKKMVSSWKVKQSSRLARAVRQNILSHVSKKYTIYDKGIKRQDFWVLLANTIPSILVETGYLTSKDEVKKLKNSAYQTRLMEGVARGINQYYGLY